MHGALPPTAPTTLLTTLVLALLLSACSTAPAAERSQARFTGAGEGSHRIVTEGALAERTFEAPASDVWRALQLAYQDMEIPVTGVREDVHLLETMNLPVRRLDGDHMSAFLDCGSGVAGPRANTFDISLTLATRILADDGGGSVLRAELDAWARPRNTTGHPVHCQSKNEIEDRIFENVSRRLAAGN